MNTKMAAEAMTLIAEQYAAAKKHPNYKKLGLLVTKRVEKNPSASAQDIADWILNDEWSLGDSR